MLNSQLDIKLVLLVLCCLLKELSLINEIQLCRRMRKPMICICKNKGADQLCSNCEADQHLCFCFMDSTINIVAYTKFPASSHLLCLYSLACVGSGQKHKLLVFSCKGSIKKTPFASYSESGLLKVKKDVNVSHMDNDNVSIFSP